MIARPDTVSLISDLGSSDEFVGVVKSVLRVGAPHASIIDICHEIPAHDVRSAALMLLRSAPYLAPGVLIAAVDPWTKSRRHIAIELNEGESVLVGPDNGIFAPLVASIGEMSYVARIGADTDVEDGWFPARDVYAPTAVRLCNGERVAGFGERIDEASLAPAMLPFSEVGVSAIEGEVLHVDRYGNAYLNIAFDQIEEIGAKVLVQSGDRRSAAHVMKTPKDLAEGETALLTTPGGLAVLVVSGASAAEKLGLHPESAIRVTGVDPPT